MAKLTSKVVTSPYTGREETYYTVTDKNGDVICGTYNEAEAQRKLQQIQNQEARDAANAADGDVVDEDEDEDEAEDEDEDEDEAEDENEDTSAEEEVIPDDPIEPIEPAPPYSDPPGPKDPIDPKFPLMDAGSPTSSFVTGEPIAPPAGVGVLCGGDAPDAGIDVAGIMEANKGNDAAASAALSDAAHAAVDDQVKKLTQEYGEKANAIPGSLDERIDKYKEDRMKKTKDDKTPDGRPYDPVLLSLGEATAELAVNKEDATTDNFKQSEDNQKVQKTDAAKEEFQKTAESAQQKTAKVGDQIDEISSHVLEGVEWMTQNINKAVAAAVANVKAELEAGNKRLEDDIDSIAKTIGESRAVDEIQKRNNQTREEAKKLDDDKKKQVEQAKIKAEAAAQKTILKLSGMLGA